MYNPIIDSAIVLALTEVIKRAFNINSRYIPLVSVAFGILGYNLTSGFSLGSTFAGLVIGLTASGLYSGTKAVAGN